MTAYTPKAMKKFFGDFELFSITQFSTFNIEIYRENV